MKKIVRRPTPANIIEIHPEPLLNRIYQARNVQSSEELEYGLTNLLPYHGLTDIDQALDCLEEALHTQQRILIVGDFDADGATSTALAVRALKAFGFQQVSYLVPNRFDFGYGLSPEIVVVAKEQQPQLIITVDNGIASIAGVASANAAGIKVLVTDHHLQGDELPKAVAIVNPNRIGDQFQSKNLAGVGVIFYVMLALRSRLRSIGWFKSANISEPNMAQFLDLVALGTVADVVNLDRNNRILVHHGLLRIRSGQACQGIKALITASKRSFVKIVASDLAYAIAPKINAAGRIDDISLGIECLLTESVERARTISHELEAMNNERREIEKDMHRQAARALDNLSIEQELPLGVCLYEESWHQGVLGILAARIKDKFHRPVIAFAAANETEIRGSARSVSGLHIRDLLGVIDARHPGLITRFGGHAMAAGLTLPRENYQQFAQIFVNEIANTVKSEDLDEVLYSDGELSGTHFSLSIAELLSGAGPWGRGFPEPIFDNVFELLEQRLVGQKHLKLTLRPQGMQQELGAIYFNIDLEVWPNYRCSRVRAAYRLAINEYNGRRSVQLMIEDMVGVD